MAPEGHSKATGVLTLGLRDLCTLSRVGSSGELSMHLLTNKQHSRYLVHVGMRVLYVPGGLGGAPCPTMTRCGA